VKTVLLSPRWLLVAAAVAVLAYATSSVEAVGTLTLPFSEPNIAVNSWFDHNAPGSGNNYKMIRYDGATWTDGSASLANCTLGVNCYDGHNGIDFGLASGSNVIAANAGVVQFIGWQDPNNHFAGFGFYIRLWHSASSYSTLYGHLSETYVVSQSQPVSRGQLVGYSDNTGQSLVRASAFHMGTCGRRTPRATPMTARSCGA